MRIAIVDDNATNLLIIEKILQKAGYTKLTTASSAMELFDILELDEPNATEPPVSLILMDLMMPGIDGIEACRRIQESERYRDIPVIFVTALGDSNKLAEALDAGAIDYVMKPINKVELLARIRSALRLKYEKDWHKERDQRISFELNLAKQVQRSILSDPIDNDRVKIDAIYRPSSELAGDFYAWYCLGGGKYGVILLDMMGHGISSSLVCMYIYSALQDTIKSISDPELVVLELNRRMMQLQGSNQLMNYYFTAIYYVLDTNEQTIEYVNAGHPAGIAFVDQKPQLLTEGCCALGFFDNIEVKKGTIAYRNQVKIVLYTDGLLDQLAKGQEDDVQQLQARLGENGEQLEDHVLNLFEGLGQVSQQDDICLVMVETKAKA
ncbi:fused response regulator/phosphatase [Paenibacillus sp. FSL H8-0537]|uniref:PP2C family protein-serine/threonine phosphatase n=1 Tax=Paenibacillus sp. FSL H8-0537 TaxID=2921399 RepID=UPI003100D67F